MLPKTIKASRTFLYDVENIVQMIVDMDIDRTHEDVTLEEVVSQILDWVYEDFRMPLEEEPTLYDENGKELN